jgi:lysophospholipase L1-like esterase
MDLKTKLKEYFCMTKFSISTPSRHPANQNGYDATTHRYRSDYVNPKFWTLNLDASVGFPKQGFGSNRVPFNVVSYQWTVSRVGGTFSRTIVKHRSDEEMWKVEVQLPNPGTYEVTLQVNLINNQKEITTRRYRLRDFLIVSVGDSFAAGQGNPDVPAIPSPDERLLCEATSISLIISAVQEEIRNFLQKLEGEGKEKIEEYLPYLGKVIVAAIDGVEDIAGYIKKGAVAITGLFVEAAKDLGEAFLNVIGIGDSEVVIPRPARWQEPNAYRSYRSGHSLAARQIETENEFGADRITFLSFARSGSEIDDGLLGPRTVRVKGFSETLAIDDWIGNRGQVEEVRDTIGNRSIDALIITIGGNDVGFANALTDFVKNDFLSVDTREERDEIVREAEIKLTQSLPQDFDQLNQAIVTQLGPRTVLITEYPTGLFTKLDANSEVKDGGPCGLFATSLNVDLDVDDGRVVRTLGNSLNELILAKADQFEWQYVDRIKQAFDGHGYCAEDSFFVSAEESCLSQGDFEGTMHPNKKGHRITRDQLARVLRNELGIREVPQIATDSTWLEPVLSIMMS